MYKRKGSRGLSRKMSLRQQYRYYKQRVVERLAYEQAFKEARGAGTIEGKILTKFKPHTYDELFEKGVSRKVKNKTVWYKGEEAIKVEIESFKRRASKAKLAEQFISNYISAMKEKGYDWYDRYRVDKMLSRLSIDRLTYLINESKPRGLPSIEFVYEESEFDLVSEVKRVIDLSMSVEGKEELKRMQSLAKQYKKYELEKMKLRGEF